MKNMEMAIRKERREGKMEKGRKEEKVVVERVNEIERRMKKKRDRKEGRM